MAAHHLDTPVCGFGQVIAFNGSTYAEYVELMKDYPKMTADISKAQHRRQRQRKGEILNNMLEYPDEESMLQYLDYFSKDSWRALPAVEKSEHKYFHCNVCTNDHFDAYSLFSRNSKILWRIYWRKATFEEKLKTWLKIKDKVKVSKYGGRTATPEEQVKIDAAKAKKQALLDEAAQTPSQQQPTQNGSEQKYVIQHDRYDFSRYQVTQQIRSCSELKIKVNWNALSRQYPVTTEDGRVVGMGYGARVIRAYAESMRLI